MSAELTPDVLTLLTGMQATLHDVRTKLTAVHAELQAKPASPPMPRTWYSVAEAAALMRRRPYTVREWCNHGRINAVKRMERRGGAALWNISADEVTRYLDKGLLSIGPDRNNLN